MWEESGAVSHRGHAQGSLRRTTWSRAKVETIKNTVSPLNKPADHLKNPDRRYLNEIPP